VDHIILEIGLALGLIAFAVALAHKLGLSNIPFLILIGIAVGPHAPQWGVFDFRFIQTESLISFMGRFGVLFLLFYLGLEANLTRLIEAGRSILVGGSIYVGINFTVGFTYGYLAGFPLREALIIAGLTTVSSSAIVAKILFDYRRMANPETQIVLGITMFEDVFLAVYLSLISGIVLSGASSFAGVLSSGGIALGFIVGLIIIGRWATPLLNRVLRISSNEVFVIVVFACLFLDNRHRVLAFEELFRGTVDSASVHPREVVRACLRRNASAVIFAHNHPSGVAEPSASDRAITRDLREALQLIGVRVLDHLVIGSGEPVSMAMLGLI